MTPVLLLAAALLAPAPPARAAAPVPCTLSAHRDDEAWIKAHCDVLSPERDARVRVLENLLRRLERLKDMERTRLLVLGRAPAADAFITDRRVIVLTRQALDLCYPRGAAVDDKRAQANLAFVLAHELAHWDHDDRFVVDLANQDASYFEFAVGGEQAQELKADRSALIDVLRAGLDVNHVLEGGLLRAWAGAQQAEPRVKALGKAVKEVRKALPLFDAGADFLAAGQYATAAAMLRDFRDAAAYEGREVLNDQAFALLQQALAALTQCDRASALRFVWPGMFDPQTLARVVTRGADDRAQLCRPERAFREPLDQARGLLETASRHDPNYLPARLNLASASLLDDKPNHALAELGDGVVAPALTDSRLSDEEIAIEAARALALYLQGDLHASRDLRRGALEALQELAHARPTDAALLFNLARVQTELLDLAAVETWQQVLRLGPPRPLADEARRQLVRLNVAVPAEAAPELEPPPCPPESVSASGVPMPGHLFPAQSAGTKLDLSDGSRWRLYSPPAAQGKPRAASPGPPTAWRAYVPVPGTKKLAPNPRAALVVEQLAAAVPLLDLQSWHGTSEAELRLVGGRRVLRFGTCARDGRNLGHAYVLDGDQAVERLTFLAAEPGS